MSLKAGTTTDFDGSMAAAIKDAWDGVRGDTPTSEQMRLLFIAVAQGVINHLKQNPDSFVIDIQSTAGTDITYTGKVTAVT
jgi:hypothetical protein